MENAEISESELNFILSQISSVSGDVSISEQTLEDLLRDCENIIPPLLLDHEEATEAITCVANDVDYCKKAVAPKTPPTQRGSSNMFKNAIDSLSEITNLVKENLNLNGNDHTDLWECNPVPAKTFIMGFDTGSSTYRANRTAIIRRDNALARVKSSVIETRRSEIMEKTARSKSFDSARSDRSSVRSTFPPKTLAKKATRQGTLNAAAKLYGKTTFVDKHAHVKPKVNSSLSIVRPARNKPSTAGIAAKIHVVRAGTAPVGKSGPVSSRVIAKRVASETGMRKSLPHKNVTSSLQSNSLVNINPQVPKTEQPASTAAKKTELTLEAWATTSTGSETFRLPESEKLTEVSQNSEAFKPKPASSEDVYKRKLEGLAREYEAIKKAEKERNNTNFNGVSANYKLLLDVCVQTEDRRIDASCQTSQPDHEDHKSRTVLPNNDDGPQIVLDDRTIILLDSEPTKLETANVQSKKTGSMIWRDTSSSSAEKRQMNIIRSLQLELDTVKKTNLRLTTQLSSLNKMRAVERSRYGIKRTSSTQTDPDRQDPTILREEAALLRDRIKILESEITALHEKRQLDLEILQNKHEEEIEVLLQENNSLSKQVGALQSWRSW